MKAGAIAKACLAPVFVGLLAFVPLDIATGILWMIGGVLVVRAAFRLLKGLRKIPVGRWPAIQSLVVIGGFFLSHHLMDYSYSVAEVRVLDEAGRILQQCRTEGRCPEVPAGWTRAPRDLISNHFGLTAQYRATYRIDPPHSGFIMTLSRNIDHFTTYEGHIRTGLTVRQGG